MSAATFKIGDVVRVVTVSAYGRAVTRISGPVTIEKQHKSNGNLIVNGAQFSVFGDHRSSSYQTSSYLVHEGSGELANWQNRKARHDLECQCVFMLRSLSVDDVPDEKLATLLAALKACHTKTDGGA